MLLRCLHPLELNTGPWTRKSSMLCSLLLLFASFFVLGLSEQAEIVGAGHHTLKDGKVELNNNYTYTSIKEFDSKEHQLFDDSCKVETKGDFIEVQYEGKLCTVDLLADFKDKIVFKVGVKNSGGIDKCLIEEINSQASASYSNLLPFIYSKNNDVIKEFSEDGPPSKTKRICKNCQGTCFDWTSHEVLFDQKGGTVSAYTHLIREQNFVKEEGKNFKNGDEEITFDLKINKDGELQIKSKGGEYRQYTSPPACAPKENPTVQPDAWRIKDKYLKGEYLLVFSLLPPSVSRVWNGKEFEKDPPSKPKCDLFLQFSTEHYRLLTAISPPTTTTSTTKTTTTTTTEAPSTTTCPACLTAAAPTCPTAPTTKRPAEKDCNTGVFVLIGIFVSLVVGLCLGGISFWFWMKRTERKKTEKEKTEKEKKEEMKDPEQSEDDPLRVLYDAEVKEKGPDAVGTFDKWKENRMKTELNVSAQESDPVDKAESKKKGETAAEREERVMKKWTEDWYEMLRKNEFEPAKREGRFKGTFEDYKKMRPIPETKTLCENFQMVKTAVVADKSVVDKGKSSSGAVKINKKVKSATTVVESEPTKTAMGTKKSTSTVIEMPQTSEKPQTSGKPPIVYKKWVKPPRKADDTQDETPGTASWQNYLDYLKKLEGDDEPVDKIDQ